MIASTEAEPLRYVFGPLPSRRLGKSLGIDPIPYKTCNWNCIYCQLGCTRRLALRRSEYIPRQAILAEVERALQRHQPGEIDWVTFVGSGEPTLHRGLGWLVRAVKERTGLPVAVITNGSLLFDPQVRQDLLPADAVLPSLDAASPRLYRRINRPAPRFSLPRLLEGLLAFRQEYNRQLWVEVMLLKGLNDTPQALGELAVALESVQPDQVHLLLPVRPPAETWVLPSDAEGLQRAHTILGSRSQVVSAALPGVQVSSADDLQAALLGIVTRHPMQEAELVALLPQWEPAAVRTALQVLADCRQLQDVRAWGVSYWCAAGASFISRKS
jgi:wyosine [tRNA(Phe)-imidazoG37] synthetase (radical SAM superfamily)